MAPTYHALLIKILLIFNHCNGIDWNFACLEYTVFDTKIKRISKQIKESSIAEEDRVCASFGSQLKQGSS